MRTRLWIWHLPARLAWHRWREKVAMAIAWRLPRGLVYWAVVRVWAHGTQGPWSDQVVGTLDMPEALTRWQLAPRRGS